MNTHLQIRGGWGSYETNAEHSNNVFVTPPASPCPKGRINGFSIIELLASVAIFSMMTLALYIVFDRANNVWTHGEFKAEQYQNARNALDIMSRELTSAIIASGGPTAYSGTIRRPYFYSTNPPVGANSCDRDEIYFIFSRLNALYEAAYDINTEGTSTVADDSLRRRIKSADNSLFNFNFTSANSSSDEIAFRVTDLNFTFHYRTSTGTYATVDRWDSRMAFTGASTTSTTDDDGKLPDFIEITLRVADQSMLNKWNGNPPKQDRKEFKIMVPMNQRSFRNE